MAKYTILRKGSNAANQHGQLGWVPQATVEAATRADALATPEAASLTVYNNQVLDAVTRFPRGFRKSPDGSYWAS